MQIDRASAFLPQKMLARDEGVVELVKFFKSSAGSLLLHSDQARQPENLHIFLFWLLCVITCGCI